MQSFTTLLVAALAGTATCSLFLPAAAAGTMELSARDDSNCTQYCSTSVGCVCTVRPSDCTQLYTVQPDDTCTTIATAFDNFTVSQLYRWNPDVGQSCLGLQAYVPICVATPWYTFTPPIQPAAGTIEGPDDVPVPTMPGVVSGCQRFELVGAGDTVYGLSQQNNITQDQYEAYNGNTTQLWSGYWVCVGE